LAVILDHYSRRVLGFRCFGHQPSSEQIRRFFAEVVGRVGAAPRHLVTDQGKQFCSQHFTSWCQRQDIRQRFGAIGKRGSIAVIEHFWRTLKEVLRAATWVSLRHRSFQYEVRLATGWYNGHRPHMTLEAATPDEVYFARRRACRHPRFEPRIGWPRAAPCARPRVLVKGQPGARLELSIDLFGNRRYLPVVKLGHAA
jgi:transposase InsO family protein